MHLGSMAISSKYGGKNFKYILLRNNAHESVGNQTTNSEFIDYKLLSKSLNFKSYAMIDNEKNISGILNFFLKDVGPSFLEVRIKSGSIENLGRPKNLELIKKNFMEII